MKNLVILAGLLASQPAFAQPAPVADPAPVAITPPAPCAAAGGLLPGSGLCRDDAFARLPKTRRSAWLAPEGCDAAAQETALPGGRWLLYAAQRCADRIARLDAAPGEHGELVLRYAATARNAALAGKAVLTLVEGKPEPFAAISALVLAGLPPKQAKRCALREPDIEGYPIDAYVFDLAPKEARKFAALDAPCGPFGRTASVDGYWRIIDGYGVHTALGSDQAEFDPASLMVYTPGR